MRKEKRGMVPQQEGTEKEKTERKDRKIRHAERLKEENERRNSK